jgi:hypothetical protein
LAIVPHTYFLFKKFGIYSKVDEKQRKMLRAEYKNEGL